MLLNALQSTLDPCLIFALLACGGRSEQAPSDTASVSAMAGSGGSAGSNPVTGEAGSSQGASSGLHGDPYGMHAQPGCQVGDKSFPWGAIVSHEGCSECTCTMQSVIRREDWDCNFCTYAGSTYQAGDSFEARDGCNRCSCNSGGSTTCSKTACVCNPKTEWWREYRSVTPEACSGIVCPDGTDPFVNECGCGCEEQTSCPAFCKPIGDPPCDLETTKAQCPYVSVK
ncbi:MAG TPA: hypothetical protein VJV79_12250 [Polyangiaceae bacterium]|nr:hypothetical protein [Polyangiaceae bacterium]